MLNFQDLPDELVLKVLTYSETKDLISCGQVSKRVRRISHDRTLWTTANLEKKIVKTELLDMILGKGCRILNIRHSTIVGSLSSNTKSPLSVLNVCHCDCYENTDVLEELLLSCCSLQHLVMEYVYLTPKMAVGICKNGKTLQTLNLNNSFLEEVDGTHADLQEIIKCCQELKEVDLAYLNDAEGLTDADLQFLVKNIPTNIEKLNLSSVKDDHVKILLSRCNKIKELSLKATWITDDSLIYIRQHLNLTLEELSLGPSDDRANNVHFMQARCQNISFTSFLEHPLRSMVARPWTARRPCISFGGFLELKFMPKLKILNLYYKEGGLEIENRRLLLPHLMIKGVL